jgi:hypothetical protein
MTGGAWKTQARPRVRCVSAQLFGLSLSKPAPPQVCPFPVLREQAPDLGQFTLVHDTTYGHEPCTPFRGEVLQCGIWGFCCIRAVHRILPG